MRSEHTQPTSTCVCNKIDSQRSHFHITVTHTRLYFKAKFVYIELQSHFIQRQFVFINHVCSYTSIPSYVFMAWYLVTDRGTLPFTIPSR
jgi:hypothetical protein